MIQPDLSSREACARRGSEGPALPLDPDELVDAGELAHEVRKSDSVAAGRRAFFIAPEHYAPRLGLPRKGRESEPVSPAGRRVRAKISWHTSRAAIIEDERAAWTTTRNRSPVDSASASWSCCSRS